MPARCWRIRAKDAEKKTTTKGTKDTRRMIDNHLWRALRVPSCPWWLIGREIVSIPSSKPTSNFHAFRQSCIQGAFLMEARCLPFSDIPHTTRLFADYTGDFARVKDFYPLSPQDRAGLRQRASSLSYPPQLRAAVADVLERQNQRFGSSAGTMKN